MCGIIGILNYNAYQGTTDHDTITLIKYLSKELLEKTETRGTDATGISLAWLDGHWSILKGGIKASDLLNLAESDKNFKDLTRGMKDSDPRTLDDFLNLIDGDGRRKDSVLLHVIGHCRAKTSGDQNNNDNNHPFVCGNVIGIHNGSIRNDEKIYEIHKNDFTKRGDCDSEAIFHLLNLFAKKGPINIDAVMEVNRRITGTYSVLAWHQDYPHILAGFRDTRPLICSISRKFRLVFIVSEEDFITEIERIHKKMINAGILDSRWELDLETLELKDDHAIFFDLKKQLKPDVKWEDLFKIVRLERGVLSGYENYWIPAKNTGYNYSCYGSLYRQGGTEKTEETVERLNKDAVIVDLSENKETSSNHRAKKNGKEFSIRRAAQMAMDDDEDEIMERLNDFWMDVEVIVEEKIPESMPIEMSNIIREVIQEVTSDFDDLVFETYTKGFIKAYERMGKKKKKKLRTAFKESEEKGQAKTIFNSYGTGRLS